MDRQTDLDNPKIHQKAPKDIKRLYLQFEKNEKNYLLIHSTKMGADKLAENTPNAPEFICPNCLLNPKSSKFR